MTNKTYALKISLAYLLFGALWILLSDILLGSLSLSSEVVTVFSVLKGWIYVGLSAFFIYIIANRYISKLTQANRLQQKSYDELTATYEELTATEEELRQQFDEILQSHEKINTQNAILSTVQETMIGLIDELNVDALLNKIVKTVTELAGTPHGFICLVNKEKKIADLKVGLGLFQEQTGVFKMKLDAGQVGHVFQTGQISIVENYTTSQYYLNTPHLAPVTSMIQVPLKSHQKVVGTIGLAYTESSQHFNATASELLGRFASLASIALNNAQLHTQLEQKLEEIQLKEQTIRDIFDATNDAIVVHDAESAELIDCNRKAEKLFGFTLKEVQEIGMENIEITCCNDRLIKTIRSTPGEGSNLLEWSATDKRGKHLYLESNYRKVTIGGILCIIAVSRDISERKKAAAELARAQTQKLALLKAIPDLMMLFDNQGIILDYNQPGNFDLYVPSEQFFGKSIADIYPAELTQKALDIIKQTINSGDIQLLEYQLLKNNQLHYLEARFVKNGDFEALAIIRDITYKKQMEQRLEFLSLHDALTGVYNRTYFEEEVLKLRSRNDKSAGIIVCDVDGLKLINDTLGHRAGDELLKVIANTLTSCASLTDVVARIGGDEFAIIVFDPNQQKMTELATAIKTSVKKYNKTNLHFPLSLSCGWAMGFTDIDVLFKEADNNMYREKMHQSLSNHSSIVQAMMKALEARDFITEGHADRLQNLVAELAQKLQLSAPMIADLKLLAKFHDIGKVGIPDNILFKPGTLTQDELTVMRSHCDIGYRIAKSAPDLAPIAEWILKHQEWWNGKGYPLYLAGEEIPLPCRILALADAFDAMTNDRPYRKAMNYQDAINEIRKRTGTQFDPALTEPFIEIINIDTQRPV
jgi:diguanylate cyclase (GGDEF)-like protein/PAS domain S-box-containing protein